ncbi:MAG TPA: hypothetical protein VFI31_15160 [Pirellulales bacterium]|nr:hypothetical protein [Pirellulales bacterium]
MVLTLSLSPDLEDRLRQEAERRGASLDAVTIDLLNQHLPRDSDRRRAAAIALLRTWAEEDAALSDEALAENAAVLRAFDADRTSNRKLFEDRPE